MSQETPENTDKNPDYRKLIEERVKQEAETLAAAEKKKVGGGDRRDGDVKITSTFVRECLYANELGDGMLFAAIHQDKFLYNKSSGSWLNWDGHHWGEDEMAKSMSAVEDVALRYLKEAENIVNEISEASKNG